MNIPGINPTSLEGSIQKSVDVCLSVNSSFQFSKPGLLLFYSWQPVSLWHLFSIALYCFLICLIYCLLLKDWYFYTLHLCLNSIYTRSIFLDYNPLGISGLKVSELPLLIRAQETVLLLLLLLLPPLLWSVKHLEEKLDEVQIGETGQKALLLLPLILCMYVLSSVFNETVRRVFQGIMCGEVNGTTNFLTKLSPLLDRWHTVTNSI